jgi:MFS family permease
MNPRFKWLLYVICGFADFSGFIVIFAVSRGLAEAKAESWYLGVVGAGLSFSSGMGSILGGWLSHRFDGRIVFLSGATLIITSITACAMGDATQAWFMPGYWLLGIGLGFLYPPLMGWLNQGVDAHANHHGVSRTLIIFCIAWNLGMMTGQLVAGSLFAQGMLWPYAAAFTVAILNLFLAIAAACQVIPLSIVVMAVEKTAESHKAEVLAVAFKRLSWIANLGGMFGGSMVFHLLPDLAVAIGVPAGNHGKLLASWRAVIIATYLVMHQFKFWHYRFSTSLASQVMAAVGLVVISQAESASTLLLGLTLLGQLVGYNYFSGLFYSTAGSSNERRALAAGIHESTLAIGMAVGTVAGGVLGSVYNLRVPYMLAAVVLMVMVAVQFAAWMRWVGGTSDE